MLYLYSTVPIHLRGYDQIYVVKVQHFQNSDSIVQKVITCAQPKGYNHTLKLSSVVLDSSHTHQRLLMANLMLATVRMEMS